jgi:hypothetical protein
VSSTTTQSRFEVLDHFALRIEKFVPRQQLAGDGDARLLPDGGERVVKRELRAHPVGVRPNVGHQQRALVRAKQFDQRGPIERHETGSVRRVV